MMTSSLKITKNLNQAAYLTALGGELVEIQDEYPNNTFVVRTNRLVAWWEKHVGLIPYRKYCNQRIRLKERARKQAGLPAHFTGKSEGFQFQDIATVAVDRNRKMD
jgi:hypothetical protein